MSLACPGGATAPGLFWGLLKAGDELASAVPLPNPGREVLG